MNPTASKGLMRPSHELLGWTELELEEALAKVKQPYYDFEIAAISKWCKEHGYKCHVSIKGEVVLRKKE